MLQKERLALLDKFLLHTTTHSSELNKVRHPRLWVGRPERQAGPFPTLMTIRIIPIFVIFQFDIMVKTHVIVPETCVLISSCQCRFYWYKLIGRARASQLARAYALACIQTLNYMLTLLILWFIYYKYH